MKNVFIIQHVSATNKRILKKIGTSSKNSVNGYIVEISHYSFKLKAFTKPKKKKFKFFVDALNFTNFKTVGQ